MITNKISYCCAFNLSFAQKTFLTKVIFIQGAFKSIYIKDFGRKFKDFSRISHNFPIFKDFSRPVQTMETATTASTTSATVTATAITTAATTTTSTTAAATATAAANYCVYRYCYCCCCFYCYYFYYYYYYYYFSCCCYYLCYYYHYY